MRNCYCVAERLEYVRHVMFVYVRLLALCFLYGHNIYEHWTRDTVMFRIVQELRTLRYSKSR